MDSRVGQIDSALCREPESLAEQFRLLTTGLAQFGGPALFLNGRAEVVWLNSAARDLLGITGFRAAEPLSQCMAPVSGEAWCDVLALPPPVVVRAQQMRAHGSQSDVSVILLPAGALHLALLSPLGGGAPHSGLDESQSVRFAQLLDAVSHELRNPLTPIVGMSEMLLEGDMGTLTGPQQNLLRHVHHAASRLTAALDGLLDLSRLYAHKREVERVPIHVSFCLERVGDVLRARPQLHAYTLTVDVPQPDLQCMTDPRLLERTLVELIEYVLRRAKPGNPYCLRADPGDTGLVISLVDLAANGGASPDTEDSDVGAFLGSAVAHELSYILGLGISMSTAEGTSRVLRVSVPATV